MSLRRADRRSLNQTKQLMADLAMFGRYYPPTGLRNEMEVRQAYGQRGLDFDVVASASRALSAQFPFENLVPMGPWSTSGAMTFVGAAGVTAVTLNDPGVITTSQYEASFQRAVADLELAITTSDSGSMLDALVSGTASLEAYVKHRAAIWNTTHPADLIAEVPPTRIPFDDTIRDWIPHMTGGRRLDMGDRIWSDFSQLQTIRDQTQVHARQASFGFTYVEMADTANRFGSGFAQLLRRLHLLFGEQIPPVVLRACYMPKVTADA